MGKYLFLFFLLLSVFVWGTPVKAENKSDLIIENVTITPGPGLIGTIKTKIRNQGTASTKNLRLNYLVYFLDRNDHILNVEGKEYENLTISTEGLLSAGQSFEESEGMYVDQFTFFRSIPINAYRLKFVINPYNLQQSSSYEDESNFENNTFFVNLFPANISLPNDSLPDFQFDDSDLNKPTLSYPRIYMGKATFFVKNTGKSAPTEDNVWLFFQWLDEYGQTLNEPRSTRLMGKIGPRLSARFDSELASRGTTGVPIMDEFLYRIPRGARKLKIVIDPWNHIQETNEDNNTYIVDRPLPDYGIQFVHFNNAELLYTVKNYGNGLCDKPRREDVDTRGSSNLSCLNFTVNYSWFNDSSSAPLADRFLRSSQELKPGDSVDLKFQNGEDTSFGDIYDFVANPPRGATKLEVILDSKNELEDSDRSNNKMTLYRVGNGDELVSGDAISAMRTLITDGDGDNVSTEQSPSEPVYTGILPDSIFYPIKQGWRGTRSFFVFSSVKKAQLRLEFANEMILEAEALAKGGKTDEAKDALLNYNEGIDEVNGLIDKAKKKNKDGVEKVVEQTLKNEVLHQIILDKIIDEAKDESKADIETIKVTALENLGETINKLGDKEKISSIADDVLINSNNPFKGVRVAEIVSSAMEKNSDNDINFSNSLVENAKTKAEKEQKFVLNEGKKEIFSDYVDKIKKAEKEKVKIPDENSFESLDLDDEDKAKIPESSKPLITDDVIIQEDNSFTGDEIIDNENDKTSTVESDPVKVTEPTKIIDEPKANETPESTVPEQAVPKEEEVVKIPSFTIAVTRDGATYTVKGNIEYYGKGAKCSGPRPNDPVIVRWGDGADEPSVINGAFSASHMYKVNQSYTLSVSVYNSCYGMKTEKKSIPF